MTNEQALQELKDSIIGDDYQCHLETYEKAVEALERQTHICGNCAYNENTCYNHGVMEPRCGFANFKLKEDDYCSRWEDKDD